MLTAYCFVSCVFYAVQLRSVIFVLLKQHFDFVLMWSAERHGWRALWDTGDGQ